MAIIRIEELEVKNDEFSYLTELNDSEAELTRGGFFPVVVIGAAWLGYSIVKEIKSKL